MTPPHPQNAPQKGGGKGSKPGPTCVKIPLGSRLDRDKPENIEIFQNLRFSRRKWPAPGAPNLTQMKRKAAIGCIFGRMLVDLLWLPAVAPGTHHQDLHRTRAGHGGNPLRPASRRRQTRAGRAGGTGRRAVPALPCRGRHETARDRRKHETAQDGAGRYGVKQTQDDNDIETECL